VIKNEAAGVTRLGAEVVKIKVQSLHDAGGNENRRTPWTRRQHSTAQVSRWCNDGKRRSRNSSGQQTVRQFATADKPVFLFGSAGEPAGRGRKTPVPLRSRLAPGGARNTARMPAAAGAGAWCCCGGFRSGGHAAGFRPGGASPPPPPPQPSAFAIDPWRAPHAAASWRSRCSRRSCCCLRIWNCKPTGQPKWKRVRQATGTEQRERYN
jgi:hypothetical protein